MPVPFFIYMHFLGPNGTKLILWAKFYFQNFAQKNESNGLSVKIWRPLRKFDHWGICIRGIFKMATKIKQQLLQT